MTFHRGLMKGILAAAVLTGGAAVALGGDDWLASREGAKVWFLGLTADASCSWSGGHDGGNYADGPGVLKCFRKDQLYWTLEGSMKKGKMEGQVRTVAGDGTTYEGSYENGLRSGQGSMKWPDGRSYVGGWANNIMHGKGLMKRPDGVIYEGDYENGLAQGKGIMTFPNGSFYDGEWRQGNPNGKGTSRSLTKNGIMVYVGDFVDGRHTGKGVHRFPDGTRYEGEFLNDAFNGQGTLFGPDGKIMMQGKWQNDKFVSGAVPDAE